MLQTVIVLYRDEDCSPLEEPFGFRCQAEDTEHAEEQCENAYPGCDIVWVVTTDDMTVALADYYDITPIDFED